MSIADTTILRLFREAGSGFVSGELISRELKVSRTAVWKHINGLREAGYIIEAVPSRGYHLLSSPDILSLEEVRDKAGHDPYRPSTGLSAGDSLHQCRCLSSGRGRC